MAINVPIFKDTFTMDPVEREAVILASGKTNECIKKIFIKLLNFPLFNLKENLLQNLGTSTWMLWDLAWDYPVCN